MFQTTLRGAVAIWLVGASACSTETPPVDTQARKTPAVSQLSASAGAATQNPRSIKVACALGESIETDVAAAVVEQAQVMLTQLRDGHHDALWNALHPQARSPQDRQPFLDTLGTLKARLRPSAAGPGQLEQIAIGTITGGVNDVARVVCYEGQQTDGAPALTMLANAGGEDVAYVSLLVPGPVFEHAVVLQLRKRERWHLLGIQVHPSRYRDMSAIDWIGRAGTLRRAQKLVPAYTALALAGAMAQRGASVTTSVSVAIEADLKTLRDHPLFIAETRAWNVGGQEYKLHGLSLAATQSDVSLVVKYVNERGLVEEFVGRDADKLMDHVRTQYPQLKGIVEAVVFEAYATAPDKAGPTIDAFRVARFF